MFITILSLAVVAFLAVFFTKRSALDSSQLTEVRADIVTTGVQLICGNCSGEGSIPVKTYLDRSGNCSRCGGHSYVLAANCGFRFQPPARCSQLAESSDTKLAFLAATIVTRQEQERLRC